MPEGKHLPNRLPWRSQSSPIKLTETKHTADLFMLSERTGHPESRDWPSSQLGFLLYPHAVEKSEYLIFLAQAHCMCLRAQWLIGLKHMPHLHGAYSTIWLVSEKKPHLYREWVKFPAKKVPWEVSWHYVCVCSYCLTAGILFSVILNGLFSLTQVWLPILSYPT